MGPSDSKAKSQINASINHPKFSNAKFLSKENKRSIEISMGAEEKQYKAWDDKIKKLKLDTSYLLLPIKSDLQTSGLCGSSGSLKLQFQDFPYLLTQEIYNRKGRKGQFQQQQMWYLLYVLSMAKKHMKPFQSKIGDIRPQNVFINDRGEIKIPNMLSWPRESSNYGKSFENEITYLAPEQLKQLKVEKIESEDDKDTENFSIGLTLLSAAKLEDYSNLYDLKEFTFNAQKLKERLNQFKTNSSYSDIFKATVSNLLSLNSFDRITSEKLLQWISPHAQKIKARQNFVFPSAPEEIDKQFLQLKSLLGNNEKISLISVPNILPVSRHIPISSPSQQLVNSRTRRQQTSSFSGQKLNFPPQIVRKSIPRIFSPDKSVIVRTNQTESLFTPNNGKTTHTITYRPGSSLIRSSISSNHSRVKNQESPNEKI